jgi:hypothetical protein
MEDPPTNPLPVSTALWTEPGPGDVVGAYRILGRMTEGGMALIYQARHMRLSRPVALKVLKPEFALRAREVRRFLEEARAIGEINHPHIVEVFDFVEDYDVDPPRIYIVMELLAGQTLSQRIREAGPLDAAAAIAIGTQVADALGAVHRANLLHRDLKASNIFLVDGAQTSPQVTLLDFGLTVPFGERQRLNLTDPGTTVGTPDYMAPEQVLGQDLDARADVYSLGVVLYEMLAGSRPFAGGLASEIMVRHVREAPAPIQELRNDPIPEALEQIVLRCLEKDPAARFQTVDELRQALEACSAGEYAPCPATEPVPVLYRLGLRRVPGMPSRQRYGVLVVSLTLLLAAAGILLGLALFTEEGPGRFIPERPAGARGPGPRARGAPAVSLPSRPPPNAAIPTPTTPTDAAATFAPDNTMRPAKARRRRRIVRPRDRRRKRLKTKTTQPTIDPWNL